MKFVFFGYDFMIGVARRLITEGHTLAAVFTFPCDNVFNFNRDVEVLARTHNVPFYTDKPTKEQIGGLIAQGCTCFVSAGYLYKIPPIDENKAYGMNLHPSYLPKGRGVMPTPHILLSHPEAAGMTLHKLSPRFDQGDILAQARFDLMPGETVESYSARIAVNAPEIVANVIQNLPEYWKAAKFQDESEAVYFPLPNDDMRTLDFNLDVQALDRIGRAFGRFGALARINDVLYIVYDFDVWEDTSKIQPGRTVLKQRNQMVISAKNGYIVLKNFKAVS